MRRRNEDPVLRAGPDPIVVDEADGCGVDGMSLDTCPGRSGQSLSKHLGRFQRPRRSADQATRRRTARVHDPLRRCESVCESARTGKAIVLQASKLKIT